MPKLSQSLSKYDLGFLRIVCQLWGFDHLPKDKKTAIQQLSAWMIDLQNIQRILDSLPSDARAALEDLIAHQGRLPSAVFSRKYGEIRQVGAGKRDREAIFLSPQSASERLYFLALIFQDFFEKDQALEEFFYVPDDLLVALPVSPSIDTPRFEGALSSEQVEPTCSGQDLLYDDVCTCLAWLRMEKFAHKKLNELQRHLLLSKKHFKELPLSLTPEFLVTLLTEAAVVNPSGSPIPERIRHILSIPRFEAIQFLYETWLRSLAINELKQLEQLECVGEWENDPASARLLLVDRLRSLQSEVWYDLDLFVEYLHDHFPDFQRPGGNYEIWLIRRRSDGVFLKGFESWYSVEGELLRYLLLGPLVWFGILELGLKRQKPTYAFRVTRQGENLLRHQPPSNNAEVQDQLQVLPSGIISVPRRFPGALRYQIARYCQWEGYQDGHFSYRITPTSLQQAQQKGLKPQQLIRLLQKSCENLPPTLIQAIRRWTTHSTEIQVQRLTILRVRSPEILEMIKKSRCSKYLHQILNPTTAVVIAGQERNLAEGLLALGFLPEIDLLAPIPIGSIKDR